MSAEMKETLDGLNRAFEEFKKTNDEKLAELAKKRASDPILDEKLAKIEKDLDLLGELKTKLEEVEVLAKRPRIDEKSGEFTKEQIEHKRAFETWIRSPRDGKAQQDLILSQKAVDTTASASGGYAVPEIIGRQIAEKLQDMSPMRQILRVITVGTSDYHELVDVNGEDFGWVGETDTRSETNTSQLAEVIPTMGTIYAYPKATEESLDDMFFDVTDWLIRKSVKAFARGEGAAFVSGNGTNKPTGFLNGTPVSTGDETSPARSFGVLQYLPTGDADNFAGNGATSVTSPKTYPGDVLIDTIHTLKSGYTAGARWLMNRTTMGAIRKFKDVDGNYLMTMSNNEGEMGNLLGYGIVEMPDMPDIAANAFPVAFGNFDEGYVAVDRSMLRVTVDDNITVPGYVKFYLRRRVGGKVKNDDAIKLVKCATS